MWGGYCPGSSRPHTPPNGGANVCELSHTFLRALMASPPCPRKEKTGSFPLSWESLSFSWWCSRAKSQSECSKPERFGELTLAWLSDTIHVFLAEVKNAAPIDSRSKLERTSLLRFVSVLNWYSSKQKLFNSYQHKKLTVSLKQRAFQIILYKARLLFQPCFQQLAVTLFLFL